MLQAFFDGGATLVDTSPMYSTAEAVLGELLTPAMQARAFIATKVWTRGEREGLAQVERSARLMKRTVLDLVQVHNLLDLDVQLRTLRRLKDEGRVRHVGITHYTVASHSELAAVVQRGAIPVLCEVDDSYCLDPRDLVRKITPRTRAIVDGRSACSRPVAAGFRTLVLCCAATAGTAVTTTSLGTAAPRGSPAGSNSNAMESDHPALAPGTRFGRYRIESLLGAGAMGAVYLATHIGLDKRVVVKVLHPEHARSSTVRMRFFREGRAAAAIRHPHVVDVTDV